MDANRRYPIGIQTFSEMVEQNYVYVDKTAYVYQMASVGKFYFLSRPRRFGKSLLVSTLKAYFEGRKELFEHLALGTLERDWVKYPVIRLDLSRGKYYEESSVISIVNGLLRDYEEEYGLPTNPEEKFSVRLTRIIRTAHEQTGRQAVVLVDEYDAPMLDSIHKLELQDYIRERIRDLFSPLKSESEHLRFVFLTGISKFSQLSVFSELNNLNIITFDPKYEGICGITEEELLTAMKPDIGHLTTELSRWKPMTFEDTVSELKRMYDGYHFSNKMTDIYNPWSLINAFEKGSIQNFWFSTGTPTSLINLLRVHQLDTNELEGFKTSMQRFDAPTERISDPIPVLFQSGYLTLKSYNGETDEWTLGFPNQEVYRGFADSLYKYHFDNPWPTYDIVSRVFLDLKFKRGTIDQFIDSIRRWYAAIPYSITDKNQNEQLYQSLLLTIGGRRGRCAGRATNERRTHGHGAEDGRCHLYLGV